MGWRDKYKVHPAADVWPMRPDDELAKTGEDIQKHGLLYGPVLWTDAKGQDWLIDGYDQGGAGRVHRRHFEGRE
jgi:hypothetical protein